MLLSAAALTLAVQAAATPATFYVSKLGDNSDGSSWERAFHTVQQALDAIPDDAGGHRVIVRPDTYMEANLFPAHRGAQGAYNQLIGDYDGSLGSGRKGWVILDSGDPGQQGFKSYDWWGNIRSYSQGWSAEHTAQTFSAIGWDRWNLRRLYATGGDGGIFFDGTNHVEPFSVVVEDCVSIGRAFGGGVASVLSRTGEPITFRRCWLWALDFWGDTAGAYVRVENPAMPDRPDAVFEDCVMVGPQCSLKASNFGFHTYTRIACNRCRLVTLNFSQPVGTPSPGIIQSVQNGKYLHVDLRDTTLMGYKLFGVHVDQGSEDLIGYTVRGDVKAYLQFQQAMPPQPPGSGRIHRMPHWPVDIFQSIVPPAAPTNGPQPLRREELREDLCELSPFIWKGRLCLMDCVRPATGGQVSAYYLRFTDAETGQEIGRGATGYGLASIIIHGDVAYAFASRWVEGNWCDVTVFRSADLQNWESKLAVAGENEGVFNTTVCEGPDGFVMSYETNDPAYPPFTLKFARSDDLLNWTKLPESTFATDRYTACPCLRYANGYYYVMYLEARSPRHFFETYITRSRDLKHWELSAANPVIAPDELDDGVNASDPEIVEFNGQTRLYYAVGDQLTWANIKCAVYDMPLDRFLESWYTEPGIPDRGALSFGK